MIINSLSQRMGLMFARFAGEVCDRGKYLVIKTPSQPGYHWGNYVVFDTAPRKGDLARWGAIYREEFSYYQEFKHMTFTWETPIPERGDTQEFEEAGYEVGTNITLLAQKVVSPVKFDKETTVRALTSDRALRDAS